MQNNVNVQSVLTFDGQNDYIDFGRNDIVGVFAQGSSAFTISGWVNPHRLTNKATTYKTHNVFLARSSDRYSDNFEFGINEDGNLDVYIDENVDNVIKTFGNGELTVGQWHFFAIVFNQGQLTIYLDGQEYTGSLRGKSLNKATSPLTLGATLHNRIYFTGQLANISVWNYPCTPAEIQRHYYQPLVGNEPGLVAYWMLNEGQGKTVRDQSGNAHDGTLRGNPTWDLAQLPFLIIAQSSNEDAEQNQIASSSEDASQEIGPSVLESVVPEEIPPESADVSEASVEVVEVEVTADLKPVSVEVPPIVETIAQSSNEDAEQNQIASSSEDASQEIGPSVLESVVPEEIPPESADVREPSVEVVEVEVTADLKPVSVEVPPIVETEVSSTPVHTATTTAKGKVRKGTKKQSEKSANIQTPPTTQLKQANKTETVPTSESEVPVNISQPKTMNTKAQSKYKILSIDGGGIRGIIPTLILAEIEKRTQKPIFSLFDLISGTSSGGILALGLTKPRLDEANADNEPVAEYSAEDLLQIYLEYGAEIFYEPFFEKIIGQIEDIFIQPKYSSEGREEILKQYFGDSPLENNLKEVFVTSYDIEQRIPVFFTNKLEKQQTESRKFRKLCGGFTLTDAALATSATPTYFAPHRVPSSHNTNGFYTLVDGGLVANNPANLAILEAQISKRKNQQVLNTEDILVVSLGTGSLTSIYPYDEVKNWGLLQWGRPLLNIVMDGGSEVVAGELERLFDPSQKETKNSYYRFQTFLTSDLEAIDNAKPENLRKLQALAHRLIAERSQEIDQLCSILSD